MLFIWFGLVILSTCHHVEDADKVGNIHNPVAIDVSKGIGNSLGHQVQDADGIGYVVSATVEETAEDGTTFTYYGDTTSGSPQA